MIAGDRETLRGRVATFTSQIAHLARYRPDDLGDFVILDHGGKIELQAMPEVLAALCGVGGAVSARIA